MMKKLLGLAPIILMLFICFEVQSASAMRRRGKELGTSVLSRTKDYLASARVHSCLTTGQGCVRLEKRLLSIARNLGLLGAGYGIGRIARPQQPVIVPQPEPQVVPAKEIIKESPAEVTPSAIDSIKAFLKSPEAMACKKFGACSEFAKWLIRAIESSLVVAGVVGGVWLGKRKRSSGVSEVFEQMGKPDEQPMMFVPGEGPVSVTSSQMPVLEKEEYEDIEVKGEVDYDDIFEMVLAKYTNTQDLRRYLDGLVNIALKDVIGETGLSLIGVLLTYLSVPKTRYTDPEKAVDAIELLNTEYNVVPTPVDMKIWSGLKKQEEAASYVERLASIFGLE